MNYIDECSTLPVPFNMIPTPKSIKYAYDFIKELFRGPDDIRNIKYDFTVSLLFCFFSYNKSLLSPV